MAADRRQSKKGQASGNKLLAVTATPLLSSLLHQTLTRSDESEERWRLLVVPPRSGRAERSRPALALGDNAKPPQGIGMSYAYSGQ